MKTLKKIIVKIGTNVITEENGLLNPEVLAHLVEQLVTLQKKGYAVILVSSGAMGAGRSLITLKEDANTVVQRQILASVGQIKLMGTYLELFQRQKAVCAQVLVTKEDFRDRAHYLNIKTCFDALLLSGVIPVVNENDVVSVSELMFTDNDELAGLISCMMNADKLIVLSNIEGIYDKNPSEKNARVIHKVPLKTSLSSFIQAGKSSFGRGGMLTKTKMAQNLASMGIPTVIAHGRRRNALLDVIAGKTCGTKFIAAPKRPSSLKRWIATSEGTEKGLLTVNEGAEKALKEKVASLLPVGVSSVKGQFHKGDVVKVENTRGESLGYGIAMVSAAIAKKRMGKKGEKALIHYDYLFLQK